MNNLKVCFALGFFMLLSSGASQSAATAVPIAHLQVMASVGPQAYLYNAKVTVNDAKGNLIIKGRTNIRGSVMFYLPESKLHYQPLKFTTTGGKIIGQTGDQFNGPVFGGHLKGEIDDVLLNKHVIAYLDLHSTIASVLSYRMTSYPYEYQLVRDAFSIGKGFPVWGIRYQNNHVSWLLLLQKIRKNHGYDNYVKSLAHKIRAGKKITELTPSRYASNYQPQTSPRIAQATTSSTSTYPQCNIPVGNGSLSSSSATVSLQTIENFGVASLNLLMANYGYASGQFGFVDNIVGMVFSGLGGDDAPSPTTVALQDVDAQLACINSQLSYLSEETTELLTLVEEEQFTTDILAANDCATSVAGNFSLYTGVINSALPYSSSLTGQTPQCYPASNGVITAGTASTCPISNSTGDLADWAPTAPMAGYCGIGGNVINDMLLGTGGGQPSAWIQLNLIYQTQYAWYTQAQVQQLQQFISYWSTIEYQYFALTNEYYNATPGGAEPAGISAGNAMIGDATQCTSGTTPSTASFCAAQSNLLYAFPPSIYSDEIAVWQTSIAVNPYPAGLAIPSIATQTGLNAQWVQDFVDWSDTNDTQYIGMGVFAVQPSYTAFNLQAVNPSIYPSGVTAPTTIEQFSYPQALRTIMPTSTQLASLQNPQTLNGQTSLAFFSNALDQIPPTLELTGYGYGACGLYGYLNPTLPCDAGTTTAAFPIAGAWGAGSAENGVGYFASDSETSFMITEDNLTNCGSFPHYYGCQTLYYTLLNSPVPFLGYSPDNLASPATSWPSSVYNPIYGALLGRQWWTQSQTASTSFNPPTPPQ